MTSAEQRLSPAAAGRAQALQDKAAGKRLPEQGVTAFNDAIRDQSNTQQTQTTR